MKAEKIGNLQRALNSVFPEEDSEHLATLLWKALEESEIAYRQVEASEEKREDLILFAYTVRLLVPTKGGRTSAWEDKPLTLTPDERYRMPAVIAKLVQIASETGCWKPREAILACLREKSDERALDKLKLFQGLM
ncbi:TPA: hypothetical protein EYP37_05125, partial [Candidatus Poribacteria bacterium]|nr:hypothetical protein [Candidatus Poribacteria bacterium]